MARTDGADLAVEVENPVAAAAAAERTMFGSEKRVSFAEMQAALAGLQDGSHAPELAMASLDGYVKGIVAAQQGPGAFADRAVQSFVGRLTAAPANWHQITVYVLGTMEAEDAELGGIKARAGRYFGLGVLLVLMQLVSAQAVLAGTYKQSCTDNDHCGTLGMFCRVGFEQTCGYCASLKEDPTATINQECENVGAGSREIEACMDGLEEGYVHDPRQVAQVCSNASLAAFISGVPARGRYPADYLASWCDACLHPVSGTVHLVSKGSLIQSNIDSMGAFDIVAYALAGSMIALAVCGELQDIMMCSNATEKLGNRLSLGWRFALQTLSLTRRMVFLPTLLATVPMLVAFQGGDALSIW
jgi:hypothetical protein